MTWIRLTPSPGLGVRERTLDLLRLEPGRLEQVLHLDRPIGLGREERRVQRDVPDVAAGHH